MPPANPSSDRDPKKLPAAWQPRFSLLSVMLLMLVLSVLGAAASYMVRAGRDPLQPGNELGFAKMVFLLFVLAAPVFLTALVSLALQILKWLQRNDP